jgi:hypothetical protein
MCPLLKCVEQSPADNLIVGHLSTNLVTFTEPQYKRSELLPTVLCCGKHVTVSQQLALEDLQMEFIVQFITNAYFSLSFSKSATGLHRKLEIYNLYLLFSRKCLPTRDIVPSFQVKSKTVSITGRGGL